MRQVCTPTCVLLKGFIYGESGETQVRSDFDDLLSRLQAGVVQNDAHALIGHRVIDDDYELYAKLLPGHDYCVLQAWATPISDDHRGSFDRARHIVDTWLPERLDEPVFKDASILFSSRVLCCQDPLLPDERASLFADHPQLVHSAVYSRQVQLSAANDQHRGLYLVTPIDGTVSNELMSAVVDDISRLEIYFRKILAFYDVYAEIYDRINKVEAEVTEQMDEISVRLSDADTGALGTWLTNISQNYGHLSILSKGLRQDSFSLHSNLSNIKSTIRAWGEQRLGGSVPISEVLLNDAEMVCGAYDGLSTRIQGVHDQLGNMIAMVRARIELGQQEQSLQQLRDLVKMERTMDVLEFVFLAAVLLDIFGFVFAALGEVRGSGALPGVGLQYVVTHLWEYPALLTALFVPVILALSYLIVRMVERLTA
jgi:hypothetical protein